MTRILVVDDEKDTVNFLAREFSRRDYGVETALSGEEAIEKIWEFEPQLMLLDLRMPGMDGMETLRRAKEIDPDLVVVVVTAVHEEDSAKQTVELGAHDYVTKPIDFNYLNLTVMTKAPSWLGER